MQWRHPPPPPPPPGWSQLWFKPATQLSFVQLSRSTLAAITPFRDADSHAGSRRRFEDAEATSPAGLDGANDAHGDYTEALSEHSAGGTEAPGAAGCYECGTARSGHLLRTTAVLRSTNGMSSETESHHTLRPPGVVLHFDSDLLCPFKNTMSSQLCSCFRTLASVISHARPHTHDSFSADGHEICPQCMWSAPARRPAAGASYGTSPASRWCEPVRRFQPTTAITSRKAASRAMLHPRTAQRFCAGVGGGCCRRCRQSPGIAAVV